MPGAELTNESPVELLSTALPIQAFVTGSRRSRALQKSVWYAEQMTSPLRRSSDGEAVARDRTARAAGRRFVLVCGVAPALLTAAVSLFRPDVLTQIDGRVYDAMLRSVPAKPADGRVVIVDIDEQSLAAIGQWPWRRDVVARLVTRLRKAGASVVALDVVFAEPDRVDPERPGDDAGDRDFASVLRDGAVVLGYAFTFKDTMSPAPCATHQLPIAMVQPAGVTMDWPAFRATGAICSLPILAHDRFHFQIYEAHGMVHLSNF